MEVWKENGKSSKTNLIDVYKNKILLSYLFIDCYYYLMINLFQDLPENHLGERSSSWFNNSERISSEFLQQESNPVHSAFERSTTNLK